MVGIASLLLVGTTAAADEATTIEGKIKVWNYSPKGDVHGLVLDDGTEVRFPPHIGKLVVEATKIGDVVKIVGRTHGETPEDRHVRVEALTAVASGRRIDADAKPPKRPEPKKPGPIGKDDRPQPAAFDSASAKDERPDRPPHEEILAELRAIRRLLEAKQAR